MEWFCGLDVGMDESAICVVDEKGCVALQTTAVTDPEAIKAALKPYLGRLRRLGHEAGSLSPWLHPELLKLGLPAVCLEIRTPQSGCQRAHGRQGTQAAGGPRVRPQRRFGDRLR